jgi:hypothetical protein
VPWCAHCAIHASGLLLPFIPQVESQLELTPDLSTTIVTHYISTLCECTNHPPEASGSLAGDEPRRASPLDTIESEQGSQALRSSGLVG